MKTSVSKTILAGTGSVVLAAVLLSGCSSDDSSSDTAANGAQNSDLAAAVEALTQPADSYPLPTEPIDGVADLAGKTMYYIPITQQSPQFAVTGTAMQEALESIGLKLQICNGNGTPTDISACINQAVDAKAAAIVTDGIPYAMASNSLDAAQAAKVPVVIGNQITTGDHPASDVLAYVNAPGGVQMAAIAQWISYDSGQDASVLINQSTDGPAPGQFVEAFTEQFKTDCPECETTINEVSSGNFSLVPSSTSSAVLKNPNLGYVVAQFQQYLQPTATGVQQASGTSIKGVTGAAQLGGLQQLSSGDFLYAAVGQASAFQGWVDVDAALRLIAGADVPEYEIPIRLFTRDSIADVELTEEAEASGEWYGPETFREDFDALWGSR